MVIDTKIVLVSLLEVKILSKIENNGSRWRPFCFSAFKKNPQRWQTGTRLILVLDSLKMINRPKNFIMTPKHAFSQFLSTNVGESTQATLIWSWLPSFVCGPGVKNHKGTVLVITSLQTLMYILKFVSYLPTVGDFPQVLRFHISKTPNGHNIMLTAVLRPNQSDLIIVNFPHSVRWN